MMIRLQDQLLKIFHLALKLKYDLEHPTARYKFKIPSLGDEFDASMMHALKGIATDESKVGICLQMAVQRQWGSDQNNTSMINTAGVILTT